MAYSGVTGLDLSIIKYNEYFLKEDSITKMYHSVLLFSLVHNGKRTELLFYQIENINFPVPGNGQLLTTVCSNF